LIFTVDFLVFDACTSKTCLLLSWIHVAQALKFGTKQFITMGAPHVGFSHADLAQPWHGLDLARP